MDDILLTGIDLDSITSLKNHLHTTFSIKDFGLLNYFLGIDEVTRTKFGIIMTQKKFTNELLSSSTVTPLPLHLELSELHGDSSI